jgi:methyltransferase (TIGR00027 family)
VKHDQASSTARLIAAAQVLASREPTLHHLVDLESAELSERLLHAADGDWLRVATHSWLGRKLLLGFEQAMLRGLIWHWLSRKRMIETLVREAMAEGFSQLVVIGAGLDTLPLRLASEPYVERIVCLDHPATQAVVRRAFPAIAEPGGRIRLLPIDLATQNLGVELDRTQALAALPTIVLVEGLLMYLESDRVNMLLRTLAALHVPRLRVVLTAMDSPQGEPVSFRPPSSRADRWLARRAEPMRSSIPAGREGDILGACGFGHVRTITARELCGLDRPGIDGENILVAERANQA